MTACTSKFILMLVLCIANGNINDVYYTSNWTQTTIDFTTLGHCLPGVTFTKVDDDPALVRKLEESPKSLALVDPDIGGPINYILQQQLRDFDVSQRYKQSGYFRNITVHKVLQSTSELPAIIELMSDHSFVVYYWIPDQEQRDEGVSYWLVRGLSIFSILIPKRALYQRRWDQPIEFRATQVHDFNHISLDTSPNHANLVADLFKMDHERALFVADPETSYPFGLAGFLLVLLACAMALAISLGRRRPDSAVESPKVTLN